MPCHTRYHLGCIRVGAPFRTRLKDGKGLTMPPIKYYPGYICEACVVRSVLGRELQPGRLSDQQLLGLERMRQIDLAHHWAVSTHATYAPYVQRLLRFGSDFGIPVLSPTPLERPPSSEALGIMWAMEHYAIQPKKNDKTSTVVFNTTRHVRSAASSFYKLDMQAAFPERALLDTSGRVLVTNQCSPTDELSFTLFNSGMKARLGTESNPSEALRAQHVLALDAELEARFQAAPTDALRIEICRAAAANLLAWLAWFRSQELFGLSWSSLTITLPDDAATMDLPPNTGVIQLRLSEETKSDRSRTADVIVAFLTSSGLSPGLWLTRLRALLRLPAQDEDSSSELIFQHPSGKQWDSAYFRQTYLWPSLQAQRLAGDPFLREFDGSNKNLFQRSFGRCIRTAAAAGPCFQKAPWVSTEGDGH